MINNNVNNKILKIIINKIIHQIIKIINHKHNLIKNHYLINYNAYKN